MTAEDDHFGGNVAGVPSAELGIGWGYRFMIAYQTVGMSLFAYAVDRVGGNFPECEEV